MSEQIQMSDLLKTLRSQELPNKSEVLDRHLHRLEEMLERVSQEQATILQAEVDQLNSYDRRIKEMEWREFYNGVKEELGARLAVGLSKVSQSHVVKPALEKYGSMTVADYHRVAALFHQVAQAYFQGEILACEQARNKYEIYLPLYTAEELLHEIQANYHQLILSELDGSQTRKLYKQTKAECKHINSLREHLKNEVAVATSSFLTSEDIYVKRSSIDWTIRIYEVPLKPKNLVK